MRLGKLAVLVALAIALPAPVQAASVSRVDVDALETATPGEWANEPIEIDLIGKAAAGPAPTAAWYSLRAQAVKK
jgi:hypothetical protein